jgi:hypothetical protein
MSGRQTRSTTGAATPNKRKKHVTGADTPQSGTGKQKKKKKKGAKDATVQEGIKFCEGETTTKRHPDGCNRAIYSGRAGLADTVGGIQYPSPTFDPSLAQEVLEEQNESSSLRSIQQRTARQPSENNAVVVPLVVGVPFDNITLWKSDEYEGEHLFFRDVRDVIVFCQIPQLFVHNIQYYGTNMGCNYVFLALSSCTLSSIMR